MAVQPHSHYSIIQCYYHLELQIPILTDTENEVTGRSTKHNSGRPCRIPSSTSQGRRNLRAWGRRSSFSNGKWIRAYRLRRKLRRSESRLSSFTPRPMVVQSIFLQNYLIIDIPGNWPTSFLDRSVYATQLPSIAPPSPNSSASWTSTSSGCSSAPARSPQRWWDRMSDLSARGEVGGRSWIWGVAVVLWQRLCWGSIRAVSMLCWGWVGMLVSGFRSSVLCLLLIYFCCSLSCLFGLLFFIFFCLTKPGWRVIITLPRTDLNPQPKTRIRLTPSQWLRYSTGPRHPLHPRKLRLSLLGRHTNGIGSGGRESGLTNIDEDCDTDGSNCTGRGDSGCGFVSLWTWGELCYGECVGGRRGNYVEFWDDIK